MIVMFVILLLTGAGVTLFAFSRLKKNHQALDDQIKRYEQRENELKKDVYRLEVLGKIKQAVLVDQSTQSFAETAFAHLSTLIPCDHASVVLFDLEKQIGTILAVYGEKNFDLRSGWQYSLVNCHINVKNISQTGLLSIADLSEINQPCEMERMLQTKGIRSLLSVLLVSHNELIGALNTGSKIPNTYKDVDLNVARDVADSLAVAIQKARLFEQTHLKAAELESLANVSSALRQAESRNSIVSILIQEAVSIMAATAGAYLWADEMQTVGICSYKDSQRVSNFNCTIDASVWSKLKAGEPLFLSNFNSHIFDFIPFPLPVQSLAILPIKTTRVMIGALALSFDERREFPSEHQRVLTSIADIGANALYRANLVETLEQRVALRTRELTTLYNIANIISKAMDLNAVMEHVIETCLDALGGDAGLVHLLREENKHPYLMAQRGFSQEIISQFQSSWQWIIQENGQLLVPDLQIRHKSGQGLSELQFASYIGVPIMGGNQIIGVIGLFAHKQDAFKQDDFSLLVAVADQLSIAIENSKLRDKAKIAAVIEERQRLARELHDSISQLLFSQVLFADAGRKFALKRDYQMATQYLERLGEVAEQAFKEMRLMIYALRPSVLESEGLLGALNHRLNTVEKRVGMDIQLKSEDSLRIPAPVEDGLFRIAQEALNNTLKHASATRVIVTVKNLNGCIELEVVDNGKGFDRSQISEGVGLCSMRERARQLGGVLTIDSNPGKGTRIRAIIHCEKTIEGLE